MFVCYVKPNMPQFITFLRCFVQQKQKKKNSIKKLHVNCQDVLVIAGKVAKKKKAEVYILKYCNDEGIGLSVGERGFAAGNSLKLVTMD